LIGNSGVRLVVVGSVDRAVVVRKAEGVGSWGWGGIRACDSCLQKNGHLYYSQRLTRVLTQIVNSRVDPHNTNPPHQDFRLVSRDSPPFCLTGTMPTFHVQQSAVIDYQWGPCGELYFSKLINYIIGLSHSTHPLFFLAQEKRL